MAFLMELSSSSLQNLFFYFLFLKFDHPILNFLQIKFYIETRF